eukprot:m.87487 g.87487  ORF g.87487 m.87487 type:complete len:779 (-) comp13109_c0_seq5:72-2408(-)
MLAKRAKAIVPLKEPSYEFETVPKCSKRLEDSHVYSVNRDTLQNATAELILICNEAVARQQKVKNQNKKKPMYPSKPLSIEYIADRLDIDDPINGYFVRSKEGCLQGFVTWTTFTTWQTYFRWDSLATAADMDNGHYEEGSNSQNAGSNSGRSVDADGQFAAELQNTVFLGDPQEGGVVWPRIAEVSLLGGLGCGRIMMQAVIEELETTQSEYNYITLQATDNSISFYESLGFIRVGAVARYSLTDKSKLDYDFQRDNICSPTYWYTDTKEDDTPRTISKRTGVEVLEILFLNKVLYDGLNANSRLKRGTPLRFPGRDPNSSSETRNTLGSPRKQTRSTYTTTKENETPTAIAAKLGLEVKELVALNKFRIKGLTKNSQLFKGSQLLTPNETLNKQDLEELSSMTDEVSYRHWTFDDDNVEYTEPSYMMARRLKPRAQRRTLAATLADPNSALHVLHQHKTEEHPDILQIPNDCDPRVFDFELALKIANGKAASTTDNGVEDTELSGKSKRAKTKRSPSAYSCFMSATSSIVKQENPKASFGELSRIMSERWKSLDKDAKEVFVLEAKEKKKAMEDQAQDDPKPVPAKKKRRKSSVSGLPKLGPVPSNLFNKVVQVKGQEGLFFVLTYIPDLQWCHLGKMVVRGEFGLDRAGTRTENTGKRRWMLAPEGQVPELDVSAFNCRVIKSRTVKKTPNADKEEWCILDEAFNEQFNTQEEKIKNAASVQDDMKRAVSPAMDTTNADPISREGDTDTPSDEALSFKRRRIETDFPKVETLALP